MGELMSTLESLGVADNTIVIFTSDNGPETTSVIHMRSDFGHDGARPWRGVKRDSWEGGHRVPLLVRWPNKVPSDTTSSQLVSLTDIMATIAAIVGVDLPDDSAEDSFNLLPALLNSETQTAIRPYMLQQAFGGAKALSLRQGPWKYLAHVGSGGNNYENPLLKPYVLPELEPTAPGQLYNLDSDPGETKNLYFQEPDKARELKTLLDQSIVNGRSRTKRL
jgi:arylsulfatase A-like enzyme